MAPSDDTLQDGQRPAYHERRKVNYRSVREQIKRYRLAFANCPPKPPGDELYCRYCRVKDDHDSTNCPKVDYKKVLRGFPHGSIAHKPGPLRFNIKEHAKENAIIINDLPEDTCEANLVKKLEPFGPLRKVRVTKDEKTGMCVGFAFASFQNLDDAESALNKFNADGYETVWFRGVGR